MGDECSCLRSREVPLPSSGLETSRFLPAPLSTSASPCADRNLLAGVGETGGLLGPGCPGPPRWHPPSGEKL